MTFLFNKQNFWLHILGSHVVDGVLDGDVLVPYEKFVLHCFGGQKVCLGFQFRSKHRRYHKEGSGKQETVHLHLFYLKKKQESLEYKISYNQWICAVFRTWFLFIHLYILTKLRFELKMSINLRSSRPAVEENEFWPEAEILILQHEFDLIIMQI